MAAGQPSIVEGMSDRNENLSEKDFRKEFSFRPIIQNKEKRWRHGLPVGRDRFDGQLQVRLLNDSLMTRRSVTSELGIPALKPRSLRWINDNDEAILTADIGTSKIKRVLGGGGVEFGDRLADGINVERDSSRSKLVQRRLLLRAATHSQMSQRQVDPLHSCIEAKCSGWGMNNYMDCIYRHCIVSGLQLGKLMSVQKRHVGTALRLGKQQDHNKNAVTSGYSRQNRTYNNPMPDGSKSAVQKSRIKSGHASVISGHASVIPTSDKRLRLPLHEFSVRNFVFGQRQNGSDSPKMVEQQLPNPIDRTPVVVTGSESRDYNKRGYNDIADACARHHCGGQAPLSLSYFKCRESQCAGKQL